MPTKAELKDHIERLSKRVDKLESKLEVALREVDEMRKQLDEVRHARPQTQSDGDHGWHCNCYDCGPK